MKKKLRILICSESTKINSGFGIYNKNLISGLYNTNKYEIAEFAAYGLIGDKEKYNIPWKYYSNCIGQEDPRQSEYKSKSENQFGKWRFDRVLLDYKPHVVIDIRDYWMSYFEEDSPFRKYFHWILMPTIDSEPQKDEWLDTYIDADAVFTYSDWGAGVLNSQTNNKINYIGTTSPGANEKAFVSCKSIIEKKNAKKSLVIDPEYFVIGTVMRNQKRKLFPELIKSFENLVEKLRKEKNTRAEKIRLYLHTSYPDAGWDIAELVNNSKESNKILMTYSCKGCGCVFASNFAGLTQYCYACQENKAIVPNVSNSISDEALGKIISAFDVYIQYSICEGFGMPQIEAAFCGVPVVTVNYSAMEDVISKIGAEPINIASKFKELETGAYRVYPDLSDTVEKLYKIVNTPDNILFRLGKQQEFQARDKYSWQKIIDEWISYLDTIDHNKYENLWLNGSKQQEIPEIPDSQIDTNLSVYENILKYQNILNLLNVNIYDYMIMKLIYFAEIGYMNEGTNIKKYGINDLVSHINSMIRSFNKAHLALRMPQLLIQEDYIDYANSNNNKND